MTSPLPGVFKKICPNRFNPTMPDRVVSSTAKHLLIDAITPATGRKLRIAVIVPFLLRPSEVWMHRQLKFLSQDDLTVITYRYLRDPNFDLPDANIIVVPARHAEPLRGWRKKIDQAIAPRCGGYRYGWANRRWLRRRIEQLQPDAILCQYGTYGLSTAAAMRDNRCPLFVHFHGDGLSAYIRRSRGRNAMVRGLSHFAGMITVAGFQTRWLMEHGVCRERIAQIPCGSPQVQGASPFRPPRRFCQFLAVGRLCEMKSPINLLRAFHACHLTEPNSRLTIIGDGDLRQPVEDYIKQHDLDVAVTLKGIQSPEAVSTAMHASDVFVQHSITQTNGMKEGWPVAIGEAMSHGLPIIATRHAGIADQIVEGSNGYLVEENDWHSMANRMVQLARSPSRQSMGEQSLRLSIDCNRQCHQMRTFILDRLVSKTTT